MEGVMIYLLERQVGFGDNEGIAFPSIKGCLAVAYQTTTGIFGFHNYGNSAAEKFAERSKKWRDWVFTHPNGKDAGVALYGVSFIRRNLRGYSAGKSPVAFWKEELKNFAHQLNFTGPILGSDLAGIFTEAREVSALVEFRKESKGYAIYVREWHDDARDGVTTSAWVTSANFTHLDSKPQYMPKEMVTDVDKSGMIRAYPERLGGL
jgi:hypothetical protein